MELLGQKGADLLSTSNTDGALRAECGRGGGPSRNPKGFGGCTVARVALVFAILITLGSVYLYLHELTFTGLTWDEWMDFEIARDYHQRQTFLTNLDDPSQARFAHLIAAGSFWLFGETYWAFKLPFVSAGLGSGIALWWFLSRLVRPAVAAVVAAMYFSCPYVLAASRTGATAGDVLVLATTLGFVITTSLWIRSERFWPYGAGCGVMCGLAIGSKWTTALLLAAVGIAWMVQQIQYRRRFFEPRIWTELLAQQWIAVSLAILACPTLMLGFPFVKSSLEHSLAFTGMALLQFDEMRETAPWYYVPAVLVSKFSPIQLLVFGYELGLVAWLAVRRRKRVTPVTAACLWSLLPIVPLAIKGFQNAHYYVGMVPAVMILSALGLERWTQSAQDGVRIWAFPLAMATLLGQFALSLHLFPDYLLAGRQFGRSFYSQFAGPAVNHCQGLPYAIREINRLIQTENAPRHAYILRSCMGVMTHALQYGPEQAIGTITPYPVVPPKVEHFVLVPGSFDYDNVGMSEQIKWTEAKAKVTQSCTKAGRAHVDWELWFCPAR